MGLEKDCIYLHSIAKSWALLIYRERNDKYVIFKRIASESEFFCGSWDDKVKDIVGFSTDFTPNSDSDFLGFYKFKKVLPSDLPLYMSASYISEEFERLLKNAPI